MHVFTRYIIEPANPARHVAAETDFRRAKGEGCGEIFKL